MASFRGNLGKPAPESRDDVMEDLGPDKYPCPHLITRFLKAGCFSWCPTDSVKPMKAIMLIFWLSTRASSLKDVDITQQIVAIYPQPFAGLKPKPTVNCKNCSYVCVYHCAQLLHIIQHRSILIILSLIPRQSSLLSWCLSVTEQTPNAINVQ